MSSLLTIVMLPFLVIFPALIFYITSKVKLSMQEARYNKLFGTLSEGLKDSSYASNFVTPLMLLRRLIFTMGVVSSPDT